MSETARVHALRLGDSYPAECDLQEPGCQAGWWLESYEPPATGPVPDWLQAWRDGNLANVPLVVYDLPQEAGELANRFFVGGWEYFAYADFLTEPPKEDTTYGRFSQEGFCKSNSMTYLSQPGDRRGQIKTALKEAGYNSIHIYTLNYYKDEQDSGDYCPTPVDTLTPYDPRETSKKWFPSLCWGGPPDPETDEPRGNDDKCMKWDWPGSNRALTLNANVVERWQDAIADLIEADIKVFLWLTPDDWQRRYTSSREVMDAYIDDMARTFHAFSLVPGGKTYHTEFVLGLEMDEGTGKNSKWMDNVRHYLCVARKAPLPVDGEGNALPCDSDDAPVRRLVGMHLTAGPSEGNPRPHWFPSLEETPADYLFLQFSRYGSSLGDRRTPRQHRELLRANVGADKPYVMAEYNQKHDPGEDPAFYSKETTDSRAIGCVLGAVDLNDPDRPRIAGLLNGVAFEGLGDYDSCEDLGQGIRKYEEVVK